MKRFVVGIDLGTTNSAVAYADLQDEQRRVVSFPIVQLVSEGTTEARPTLPSFLYLGGEHDLRPGALKLPWAEDRDYAVGEFARAQGARVPGRLVSSAKSWLCHGGVDRNANILPWAAADEVQKISPVEASSRYLQHLREAWRQRFPKHPLEEQEIILTVPASFDEVARELTVEAAQRAGLAKAVLLEEPQAAFYAWLQQNEATWEGSLGESRLIAVVDVGGGTTDFSLIQARTVDGRLALERTAVGDHLLLGGDNIDVALARQLEPRLGGKLDGQRWQALTNLCRNAKEALLAENAPEEWPIRLVGRGSSVIGGTLSATLKRQEVESLVLDGFFPLTAAEATPRRNVRAALQEFGLPFAQEPEISRHLAQFLRQHRAEDAAPWPDALLFNGGALKPAAVRNRIRDLIQSWSGNTPHILASVDLDLAVARGAAYFGLVRRGRGVRIRGGAARAYFIGLGATDEPTVSALCLVPRGMESGQTIELGDHPLEVVANRAVQFPLFASTVRTNDQPGALITAARDELTELPPIRTILRFGKKLTQRALPVRLSAHLTEIGTLELWCDSVQTEHRWRLQFQLRDPGATAAGEDTAEQQAETAIPEERLEAALAALRAVFPADKTAAVGDPIGVMRVLEEFLGTGKDAWPLLALRRLWDALWEGRAQRALTQGHEARWFNLAGFLLRPGFGTDTDEVRVQQLWRLRSEGLKFARATQGRAEWWNLWKRIAGGLNRQQQMQLHAEVAPWLLPRFKAKAKGLPKVGPQEIREYWQLIASCERISPELKAELGNVLVPMIVKGDATDAEIWSLGRLGERAPFHGPLNCVVTREVASQWVEKLLPLEWKRPETTAFAVMQMARCTGDRESDLDLELRKRVAERLRPLPRGERAARLVLEVIALEGQERAKILDESLPIGLQLRPAQ